MLKTIAIATLALILAVATTGPVYAQQTAGEPTWTVNFKDSDIREVIKFISEVTGKTVVIDPRVKGRVEVISQAPLNERQLLDLFRSVLEVHDFLLVEVDNVVRIVPVKEARSAPLPVTDDAENEDGYVTEVIQLKNIAAAKVLPVLRPLVAQHSHLAAYDPSNAIVVSDTAANIRRVKEIITKIDTAALPTTEIVQLKHADADDLVSTLTKLDRAAGGKNAAPSNQLMMVADKRNNSVLITGEDIQRHRVKTLIARLDRPRDQEGNVRVVYLEYAKAKDVATVLTKVVQNMLKLTPGDAKKGSSSAATVEADEETNSLLITASVDLQNSLMAVIRRLDIRRAQVLVEAIIVEINADAEESLGVEWLFSNETDGIIGSSISNTGPVGQVATGAFAEDLTQIAGGLAATSGQVLGVVGTTGAEKFVTLLTALRKSNNANILSTPSLMTMDNHEASISVGQRVPFQTGSFSSTGNGAGITSPFTTTQREEVGILLTVTPQVNEGDKILLDVSQEVSSLTEDNVGGQPITSQSKIETQILATDGEILVLGGLIKDDIQDGNQKVPLLGSIPIVGNLFKFQSTKYVKSNLMVFLRAKIMRDDEAMVGAAVEKYRFIRNKQLERRKQGLEMMDADILPLIPEIDEKGALLEDTGNR